jgi:hypothetical protein
MMTPHRANAPPANASARRLTGREEEESTRPRYEQTRELQLLCAIARSLVDLGCKLDDLVTLSQQQTDMLRRLIERNVAP